MSDDTFEPEWISPPGETISDILEQRGLSTKELANLIGETEETAQDLLEGRLAISIGVARRLEGAIGGSVAFWISRDHQYREDASKRRDAERHWLRELPLADMVKFGWLSPRPGPSEETSACLDFFDVPSIGAWRRAYAGLEQMAAFKTSRAFDSRPAAVAAWLRRGDIEAAVLETKEWNASTFEESLASLRSLTRRKDPGHFVTELQRRCAEAGVAVVIVRAPAGCRESGAVRFISPTKALVQLSFRYLSDDHFWFTLFHEAGHLLLHRDRILYLESLRGDTCGLLEGNDPLSEDEEAAADDFAARILIPDEFRGEFDALRLNPRDVIRFSVRIGVSPGIVVGQLQHYGRVGHNRLNMLKRRYRWTEQSA